MLGRAADMFARDSIGYAAGLFAQLKSENSVFLACLTAAIVAIFPSVVVYVAINETSLLWCAAILPAVFISTVATAWLVWQAPIIRPESPTAIAIAALFILSVMAFVILPAMISGNIGAWPGLFFVSHAPITSYISPGYASPGLLFASHTLPAGYVFPGDASKVLGSRIDVTVSFCAEIFFTLWYVWECIRRWPTLKEALLKGESQSRATDPLQFRGAYDS